MLLLGRFDTQISAIHNWALTDLFVAGSAVSVLIRVLHRRRRQDELVEGDRLQRVRARGQPTASHPSEPIRRTSRRCTGPVPSSAPSSAHHLVREHTRHAGASGTLSAADRSARGPTRRNILLSRVPETFSTRPRCPGASGSGPSPHPRRAVTTSLSSPYGRVSSPTIQWRPGASRESSQTGSARSNCSRWTARAGPPRCAPPSSEPRATRRGAPTRSHRSTQMPSRTSPSFSTFPKPK